MTKLLFEKITANAIIPKKAYPGDAGYDLASTIDLTLESGQWRAIPTGLAIGIPAGHEGQIHPRSGLANNRGIGVVNAPGTIDHGFTSEVNVIIINHGKDPFHIRVGDRIAQLVVARLPDLEVEVVERLPESERGARGLGPSGVS